MKNSILLMIGLFATSNAFAEEVYRTAMVSSYSIGTDGHVPRAHAGPER